MNWDQILQTKLQITTGDGKTYEPFYMVDDVTFSYDFNISEFEFPEVAGTKVDRRLPKGRRFPMVIYFQGPDNVDQAEAFRISANDLRAWVILHPFYGQITAHPLSMEFDNSKIIVTKITFTAVETIDNAGPEVTAELKQTAIISVDAANETANEFMSAEVAPVTTDVTLMQGNVNTLYSDASGSINDDQTSASYYNAYQKALNAVNNALNEFTFGVAVINDFIATPANFAIAVRKRLEVFETQLSNLYDGISSLISPNEKKIFETQAGTVVSAAIKSSLLPFNDDYKSAVDVMYVIDKLTDIYNGYIDNLQTLQTDNGSTSESYLPNYEYIANLDFAVNYALSNLMQIALLAQQERIIYLEYDSNIIIQAHRFYGISQDPENDTLQRFIDTNNITFRETLQLKKGRQLKYYV